MKPTFMCAKAAVSVLQGLAFPHCFMLSIFYIYVKTQNSIPVPSFVVFGVAVK